MGGVAGLARMATNEIRVGLNRPPTACIGGGIRATPPDNFLSFLRYH